MTNLILMSTVTFHSEAVDICWYIAPRIPVQNTIKSSRKFRTTSFDVSTVYVQSDDPFLTSLQYKGLRSVIKSYQRTTMWICKLI